MALQYSPLVVKLLSEMTLEEKVAQMIQIAYNKVTPDEARQWAAKGAGSFLHVLGDNARELQKIACESRLGVPLVFGIDAIHGHGLNDHATIFPSQLAAACSWNRDLLEQMGRVTAREVATDGLHWTFSPVLCLGRDARWGRIDETFGEDPYLAGELGAAIIKGYQGDSLDASDSILACAKHYCAYGEATGARDAYDTQITMRKMRETFLPPFEKAVEAGCATFMTAYGSIDGTPFTVSRRALYDILKEELNFDGFVVTDWDNVNSLVGKQRVSPDIDDAVKRSAEAGNDMIMTSWSFYEAAVRLVKEGKLEESVIDEAVARILSIKERMGLFRQAEKTGVPGCIGCDAHQRAAMEAARQSIVLMKNETILPFSGKKRIAVIGRNADDLRAQYGDWTYFTHPNYNPDKEPARPYVTIREGMEAVGAANGSEIVYAVGCGPLPADNDQAMLDAAVETARSCDAIVLVIGDCKDQHGETMDRADLNLSGCQQELFDRLRALNLPLCTVFLSSKPLCITKVYEQTDALLIAFNGGAYGGQAVAEAVFGQFNPCGKLPISFPHHVGQSPVYYSSLPGWHGGRYCDMPETPLFTFGQGISYTTFRYDDLRFDPETFRCSIRVTNTGDRNGTEIVQVYFNDVYSSVMTPVKQLIAFQRVALAAGESKTVVFQLDKKDFSLVLPDERRVTEPGEFILMAGSSARDEDLLTVSFSL